MRFDILTSAALAAAVPALGRELPKDEARAAQLYDNGVMHERLMQAKMV